MVSGFNSLPQARIFPKKSGINAAFNLYVGDVLAPCCIYLQQLLSSHFLNRRVLSNLEAEARLNQW